MTVKRIFGSGPNQIARNKDLGSLAWQNKTGLNLQNTGATYIVGGSPALPNAAQIGFYDDGSSNGHLEFYTTTSGTVTERMRIDFSGNVGIGGTSNLSGSRLYVQQTGELYTNGASSYNSLFPSGYVQVLEARNVPSGAVNASLLVFSNTNSNGNTQAYIGSQSGNSDNAPATMVFGQKTSSTAWTERMRIDSSGNLLVGTASDQPPGVGNTVVGVRISGSNYVASSRSANPCGFFNRTTSDGDLVRFSREGTQVGSVSVTTTATTYNTSSDYRLKENIQPMQNALGVVAQLNPVTYTWKADGSDGQGFIAHELQAVVSDCVTGEKDAVDAEGNPVYQGIDTSFLVATLTKAIQELKAELDELKAKVN